MFDLKKKSRPLFSDRRQFYWVLGRAKGDRVILGAYLSYDDADRDGYLNFQQYEVFLLPTIDRVAAKAMLRKKVLDETHSVAETLKHFRHIYKEKGED